MCPKVAPLLFGRHLETVPSGGKEDVLELSSSALEEVVRSAPRVQSLLSSIPIEERLEVIEGMARLWKRKLDAGSLDRLKAEMSSSTGYSPALMDTELSFVPSVLGAQNIRRNLEASVQGGAEALHRFVGMEENEMFRHVPVGPVLIISSGNSIVPTLIPTVVSLVTGNLTILKPSIANYSGVVEVFKLLDDLPAGRAVQAVRDALVISYFAHGSPSLKEVLERLPVGMVNFWGAEPARSIVANMVGVNPHHPRFFVNGPYTGMAFVEEGVDLPQAADDLALDMVLYDQQLCSSPTAAVFIGGHERGKEFLRLAGDRLDRTGMEFPLPVDPDRMFILQGARRYIQTVGGQVLSSKEPRNPWTLVLSKDRSSLEGLPVQFPSLNLFGRRRFLEVIVVPDAERAVELLEALPRHPAFLGIDGVQSVGLAVTSGSRTDLVERLVRAGVHRILPLGDMFMRGAVEPYDGVTMSSLFTRIVYWREGSASLGEQP
ncbi:MAG: aldehyde dehydrogenase family protein [Methanomassiliicoccales archaeon]|nr:aldehyde dehydrogenase family protein [Methanomassiliicoccales archaeon]